MFSTNCKDNFLLFIYLNLKMNPRLDKSTRQFFAFHLFMQKPTNKKLFLNWQHFKLEQFQIHKSFIMRNNKTELSFERETHSYFVNTRILQNVLRK